MPRLADVTWPTVVEFRAWLGASYQATAEGPQRSEVAFSAAYNAVWNKLDETLLPENTYRPTVDEDGTVLEVPSTTCPPEVRGAILLQAGRLFTRRDSLTGVLSFAEYGVRLSKLDPDVELQIHEWKGGAMP